MNEIFQKLIPFAQWAVIICVVGFLVLTIPNTYLAKKTGAGLCASGERVESSATNSKKMKAEIHLCPDVLLSYHYYLETIPSGGLFERRPLFGEGLPPPTLEWMDDKTLKVTLPKNMYHEETQIYNGIHIIYKSSDG